MAPVCLLELCAKSLTLHYSPVLLIRKQTLKELFKDLSNVFFRLFFHLSGSFTPNMRECCLYI